MRRFITSGSYLTGYVDNLHKSTDEVILTHCAETFHLQRKFLQNYRKKKPGPRSAVDNVSGNRCDSYCRSRGHGFDPGMVPYFR